jgi:alkylation response protein AidB-like acyl-CoA dehydrogenase
VDFRFTDDQLALRDLAREILGKEVTRERLRAAESSRDGVDRALWDTLAGANLLGLAVPESLGGSGLGLLELCLLLAEVGRSVAPIPALESLVLAGLPLAELGTEAQREQWLPRLARGEAILGAAPVDSENPARLATRARAANGGFVLDGLEHRVAAAHLAARVLVPARMGEGVGLFLVDPRAEGVTLTRQRTSSGEVVCDTRLRGVRVGPGDLLGGAPVVDGAAARIRDCARAAVAVTQLGVCERALEITSAYVTERQQFGVPIGSFQAVQHRAADAYVDLEAMRWTAWRAAWLLARGGTALRETAVAKFWAAEAGARIVATCQHLHAGIGVDLDHPIHRHFLWSKRLELALGAATPELARLGRDLARTGPAAWA